MSTRVGNTITTKGTTMRSLTTTAAVLGGVFLATLGAVGVAAPATAATTTVSAPVASVRPPAGGVTTLGRVCHYVTVKHVDPWYMCVALVPTQPKSCVWYSSKLICD